jgi:CRP/FNR family transcriptional activator FtrB
MMPEEEFVRFSQTDLAFAAALNRILAGHWRLLLRHLTQTKSRDADTRLIGYLTDNVGVTKGAARFVLPGSKKALAAHLGITPETLSRSLKRLNRLGVTSKGSEMHIADVSRLRRALLLVTSHEPSQDALVPSGFSK